MTPGAERGECLARGYLEPISQQLRGAGHGAAVRSGIGYKKEHVVDATVAHLQRESPQQGL